MGDPLRVRVLGEFRFDGADLAQLRSRKARALLKILALQLGATVSADALIDALWGDELPADPARDLSVLVSRARAVVGNDRLQRGEAGYVLSADWCDRDEIAALTREAARRQSEGDVSGARVAAEAALAISTAELLTDEPEAPWARTARREAAAVIAEARSIAASAALSSGHAGDAAAHARAALAHDPFDETALRLLMRAHVLAGKPASALSVYAQTREHLAEELGVSPAAETEALHESILRDEPVGATPVPVIPADAPEPVERRGLNGLVGREFELALIDAAFERSRERVEVVLVTGEAGAGKTALIDAWAATARSRGVLVLSSRAQEGIDLALQPVLDALASSLLEIAADPPAGPGWVGIPGPSATSAAMQQGVFDELAATLRAAAPPGGLALIVDDVHLADRVTLAWLRSLLRRPTDHRIMVMATKRIEEDVELAATTVIHLGPLDREAVAALFGRARAEQLLQRTGGNALLLVELGRVEGGTDDGAARGDAGGVPIAIRDAVVSRLRRMSEAGASTLRTAALLGATIDLDLLAGVLGVPALVVLEHLDEGVRRSFLTEADGQMMFRHDLVRAALAADATAARRAWVHREAARLLDGRGDANPLEVAYHARAAGDAALTAAALADAADVARTRFDLDGAARLLDDAVATNDSASLRLRRSRLQMARGDMDAADRDAEAAMGLGAGAAALELRAWAARNRHDMETAIRLGLAGAELAGSDPTTRASCLVAVALAHRGIGDLREANRVMAEAEALQADPSLGLAAWIGVLRVHQGRPRDALAALEPMVGAEAGGLLSFWVEHVLQMLAHSYGHLGRAGDALAMLDRLDVELERRGSAKRYGGVGSTYRCWILRNLGAPEAADIARAGIEVAASTEIRTQSQLDLADALLGEGRSGDAADALGAAIDGMQMRWFHNRWRAEQRAAVITARLHLSAGRTVDALDAAGAATAAAEDRGDARYSTIARLLVAQAGARLDRPINQAAVLADLAALEHVAALESWWLAADIAADTGWAAARAMAERFAVRLLPDAAEHADTLRLAAARRFT